LQQAALPAFFGEFTSFSMEEFEEEITFYYPDDIHQAMCKVVPSMEMMHHKQSTSS